MKDSMTSLLSAIIIGAVLLGISFMVLLRVDQFLKIKAVNDCARISSSEKTIDSEKSKVIYPLVDVYKTCLKDKGYENTK